jgi:hypothetical protein
MFAMCASLASTTAYAQVKKATGPVTYSSNVSDFVVGKTVYLRSTKTRLGSIISVDTRHRFPRSFARPQMMAVLILRKDGPREWVPIEGITRIYVVDK